MLFIKNIDIFFSWKDGGTLPSNSYKSSGTYESFIVKENHIDSAGSKIQLLYFWIHTNLTWFK